MGVLDWTLLPYLVVADVEFAQAGNMVKCACARACVCVRARVCVCVCARAGVCAGVCARVCVRPTVRTCVIVCLCARVYSCARVPMSLRNTRTITRSETSNIPVFGINCLQNNTCRLHRNQLQLMLNFL